LKGDGGLGQLLSIAFPMFISQAAEAMMMFVDRLFLARLGRAHIAAAMGGGMTCFMMFTFFLGIIGYTNALVAQYLGSNRKTRCGVASAQGIIIALLSYPLIVLLRPVGLFMLTSAGHNAEQLQLEISYYSILIWFAFLPLLRCALSSFFSGIGRTKIVMLGNIIAMLVNVAANYVLIFGKFGFPVLGMRGAAYGTIIGSGVGVMVLVLAYFESTNRREYFTLRGLRPDRAVMATLLRFGLPSGVEFFLNMAAFTVFVQLMHSYGKDVAAAVTITFNWDMVAFIPLVGVSIATTSLVGRYMGAQKPEIAKRAAYSGLFGVLFYTLGVLALFLSIPHLLVGVFTPDLPGLDYAAVVPRAVFMLRLVSIYLLSDAVLLVFGGALRGAGDTQWVMRMSVFCHWMLALISWIQIRILHTSPQAAWVTFVVLVTLMGGIFFWRFRGGAWMNLRVIEKSVEEQGEAATVPTATGTTDSVFQDWPEAGD